MPFTAPVHLGTRKFPGEAHGHFTGMIDEVRFYDRPLTAEEVIQNFESTEPYSVGAERKIVNRLGNIEDKMIALSIFKSQTYPFRRIV